MTPTLAPARIEVVLVFPGPGAEADRKTVAVFLRPEKIAALRDDPGVLGALLRDAITKHGEVRP